MTNNPFQSPQQHPNFNKPVAQTHGRGYVKQVPVIASLMIVQGGLLLIFTVIMVFYSIFFGNIESIMSAEDQARINQDLPGGGTFMVVVFAIFGGLGGVLAIMHFIAAGLGFAYKSRIFGIVTMILGLSSALTCYCAPTAVGLAVYGLIIYFNPAVAQAFALRKQGIPKNEILNHFPN